MNLPLHSRLRRGNQGIYLLIFLYAVRIKKMITAIPLKRRGIGVGHIKKSNHFFNSIFLFYLTFYNFVVNS